MSNDQIPVSGPGFHAAMDAYLARMEQPAHCLEQGALMAAIRAYLATTTATEQFMLKQEHWGDPVSIWAMRSQISDADVLNRAPVIASDGRMGLLTGEARNLRVSVKFQVRPDSNTFFLAWKTPSELRIADREEWTSLCRSLGIDVANP